MHDAKRFFSVLPTGLFCLMLSLNSWAQEAPLLFDLTVTGNANSPSFEPQQLLFNTLQEYVLVLTNDKPYSVVFHYGKFGQEVSTMLLQGTPHVSQDSVTLIPNSKVTWHFIPQKEGQFKFFASIPGSTQLGKGGEIIVKNLPTATDNNVYTQYSVLPDPKTVTAQTAPKKKGFFTFWRKKEKAE